MRTGLCSACAYMSFIVGSSSPFHCNGEYDRVGTDGLLGSGFQCSCECAVKDRAERRAAAMRTYEDQ